MNCPSEVNARGIVSRFTWVTRSILDYRVPVFEALDELVGGGLSVLYLREVTPFRVPENLQAALCRRAVGLTGDKRLGSKTVVVLACILALHTSLIVATSRRRT
jgi:hypothetical protein